MAKGPEALRGRCWFLRLGRALLPGLEHGLTPQWPPSVPCAPRPTRSLGACAFLDQWGSASEGAKV